MPISRMTSTTSGWTWPSGSASLPADSARWRPLAACSNSAALICERPALCRQTKRAVAISERPFPGRAITRTASASQVSLRRHSRVWRSARVLTYERTGASSKRARMASAQARMSSGAAAGLELLGELRAAAAAGAVGGRCGRSGWRRAWSRRARGREPRCVSRMARTSSSGRPAGSGMLHASTVVGHVWAGVVAAHRDRPVGVQLHFAAAASSACARRGRCRPRASPRRPLARRAGGLRSRRTRRGCRRARALEERLRHLRAAGVVVADEQDVLHEDSPS